MPISEKILKEIDHTNVDENMKVLMKELLQLEDDGAKRWSKQYEEKIEEYLKKDEEAN
jgi:hypothetical protein